MKQCSYCGAEYPDDATACAIDQTPFEQPGRIETPPVSIKIRRKMPLSLSIVSCYLIASGIFQIVGGIMFEPNLASIPILNVVYGILILAVSRGLRRYSRHWYVCAIVVIGLVISLICLQMFHGFIHSVPIRHFVFYLKDFGVWLCILIVLTRPSIRGLFYDEHDIDT